MLMDSNNMFKMSLQMVQGQIVLDGIQGYSVVHMKIGKHGLVAVSGLIKHWIIILT